MGGNTDYQADMARMAEAISRVAGSASGRGAARIIATATEEPAKWWASLVTGEGDMADMLDGLEDGIHRLERYGLHGHYAEAYPGPGPAQDEELRADLGIVRTFLRLTPQEWFKAEDAWESYWALWLTYGRALARLHLDSGERLHLDEVVLLSGLSPRSVRNATAARHGEQRLPLRDDDTVGAEEALAWLSGRRSFTPTVAGKPPVPDYEAQDDVAFVPVASDGSEFEPGTARLWFGCPHFEISGKEHELVEDYFEALGILTLQARPEWARQLPNGRLKWVRGVAWNRRSRRALAEADKESVRAAEAQMEAYNEAQLQSYEEHLASLGEGRAEYEQRMKAMADKVFGDE